MSESPPQLTSVQIAGFKSIREMPEPLRLGPLNVLIGANGSGKSNLLSLFRLLSGAVQGRFQQFVARQGFARTLMFVGVSRAERIRVRLSVSGGAQYAVDLIPVPDDTLVFASESLSHTNSSRCNTFEGILTESVLRHEVPPVPTPDELRNDFEDIRRAVLEWSLYHFHDTSEHAQIRGMCEIGDDRLLRSDGRNLAAFLYTMKETAPLSYRNIRDTIRLVAPFFQDFVLTPNRRNENFVNLEWTQAGTDAYFGPHQLSDGTLRFACLATLLMQPSLPGLIVVDEPELGLHPAAIEVLAGLLRSASKRTQIIVSTQSAHLVDQFDPEDVIVVDRQDEQSVFRRLEYEPLKSWLEDYSLGQVWMKNVVGGGPWS